MFKTNEYFDGKVKSIAFSNEEGDFTTGVIAAGEYEFTTTSCEEMIVISGEMEALLPDETEWESFEVGEGFEVGANKTFKVRVSDNTCYLCNYFDEDELI